MFGALRRAVEQARREKGLCFASLLSSELKHLRAVSSPGLPSINLIVGLSLLVCDVWLITGQNSNQILSRIAPR